MPFKEADPSEEYKKNKDLKKEDFAALRDWADKQPHLPQLSDFQLILFLQTCYFSRESAKNAIDIFYTLKPHCPEFFSKRDPFFPPVAEAMAGGLYEPLSTRTPEGYVPIYCRVMEPDASKFTFSDHLKVFDMSVTSWFAQEGTAEGIIIIYDMKLINLGHFARFGILAVKKYLYYLQEAMPVRLKGLHFTNVVPFIDKLLAIMKPFMKKELLDMFYLHTESMDSLYKHVPQACLPRDLGGTEESMAKLQENMKQRLINNKDYFAKEELQTVDESRRVGKPKNVDTIFGVEGSFKKLDID